MNKQQRILAVFVGVTTIAGGMLFWRSNWKTSMAIRNNSQEVKAVQASVDTDPSKGAVTNSISPPFGLQAVAKLPDTTDLRGLLASDNGVRVILAKLAKAGSPSALLAEWERVEAELDPQSASRFLMALSDDIRNDLKTVALQAALVQADGALLQAVVDRFDTLSTDAPMRTSFREFVQNLQQPEMIEALTGLGSTVIESQFSDDDLAWAALAALVRNGSAPAVDAVLNLADQATGQTQANLFMLLRQVQSPEAMPVLAGVATAQGKQASLELRLEAIRILGQFPDLFARETLQSLLQESGPEIVKAAQAALLVTSSQTKPGNNR